MRRQLALLLMFAPSLVLADDMWLEAAASNSIVDGRRFGVSRTLDNFNLDGVLVGLSHARYDDSWWTLFEAGLSRRIGERAALQGKVQIGPGEIDDSEIGYVKMMLGGSLVLSQQWSMQLSDTYVDIDETRGHIIDIGFTRSSLNGLSITVNGLGAVGPSIGARQIGAKFTLHRGYTYLGGLGAGETRNLIILNEFGQNVGGASVRLRQVYAGVGIPIGRVTLLTVFDYLRLDDVSRRELSLVLKVPLGSKPGAAR